VFVPKGRKQELYGKVRKFLGPVVHEWATQRRSQILEGYMVQDHGPMLIVGEGQVGDDGTTRPVVRAEILGLDDHPVSEGCDTGDLQETTQLLDELRDKAQAQGAGKSMSATLEHDQHVDHYQVDGSLSVDGAERALFSESHHKG
jgi:hypothetical protein